LADGDGAHTTIHITTAKDQTEGTLSIGPDGTVEAVGSGSGGSDAGAAILKLLIDAGLLRAMP